MKEARYVAVVRRRELLISASSAGLILALAGAAGASSPDKPAQPSLYDQALDKILGDAKPRPEKISIEIPEIAENGNTVPYTIAVASPMTETDHIKAVHVLSTGNPLPNIASFYFGPAVGKAVLASRMRLAKTQEVVILAERADGKFLVARRTVKVTIGGCGG